MARHGHVKTSWSRMALQEVGRLICSARGHVLIKHFEPGRICLECVSCGHRSPGWEVKSSPRALAAGALAERPERVDRRPALVPRSA
jgi:hypothetical protein